ncbi:LacI family DNA-binding transcriptional regulator [Paenibacillus chungangensis]|uniref:LacI family DNA-binding transcriptional regulator n=1 Tax=Paenibacillus chungangensis TaxID=696535 RepID=A0ABW3HL47_9BACL
MKPTIYDVAEKSGVSIATVSKVINNTGRISKSTREKVTQIMNELQYQPSIIASALTGKITFTFGMIIPDLANPFFAEIARAVEDRAHELGFSMIICSTDNSLDKELKYTSLLLNKNVDGIILATGRDHERDSSLHEIISKKVPVVLIAREMPALAIDTVLVDDYLGGLQATAHLIEQGHQRIAVIAEYENIMSSRERVRGYKAALSNAGIPFDESMIVNCGHSIDDGKQSMRSLIQSGNPPTAIFACNDIIAIGAIQAARELEVKVPDHMSVIGFDNTVMATLIAPQLTTIAQPIKEMGRYAADLLISEIKGTKSAKQRIVLLPELVVRQSTGEPQIAK